MPEDPVKRPSQPVSLSMRWSRLEKTMSTKINAWNKRSSAEAEERLCRICQTISDMLSRIGIGRRRT